MKNYNVALLLTFFLGGIGVHKFYLGKTGAGIAYFIFSWTFIPAFLALIDFIGMLTGGKEAFDKKYNSGRPL